MDRENDLQSDKSAEKLRRFTLAFQELIEGYLADTEDFSGRILQLSNQLSQSERMQTESLYHLETINQLLANMTGMNHLLEKAGEANVILSKQYYEEHVIEPMLRSLLPVFDMIEDYRRHQDFGSDESHLADSVCCQLMQFIANYSLEMFSHSPGDSFDPKSMKPIGWESTPQKHLENSVACSLQCGFKLGESRILRQETVRLFKFEPPKVNQLTPLQKENEHDHSNN